MPLGTKPHGAPGNGDAVEARARDLERWALELLRGLDSVEPQDAPPPAPIERATGIDFHVHLIDPARNLASLARLAHRGVGRLARKLPLGLPARAHDALGRAAEAASTLGPRALLKLFPIYRRLPPLARAALEAASTPSFILHALARGFHDLLLEDMARSRLSHAVVIPTDPASTDYVLDVCARDLRLFPVALIGPNERDVPAAVARARNRGAVGVKLHACQTGCAPDGAHATSLVDAAADQGLFVIVHTGRARIGLYKAPGHGDPRAFVGHFDRRPDATFVLAHMNMAEPELALDVARRRPNVYVDTSWQETRDVRRAVAVLGAERLLLASDWPFGGDLMVRARRALERTGLPSSVLDLILFANAQRLIASRRAAPAPAPVAAGASG